MPSEIFPPGVRSKAVGVAISTNWLTNVSLYHISLSSEDLQLTTKSFIVALITPRMLKSITFGTFYFFLVFCLILIVWVYFCVPETKGLRIEEMDQIFGGNQGVEDMARIADIRRRLGITRAADGDEGGQMDYKGEMMDKGVDLGVSHHEAHHEA